MHVSFERTAQEAPLGTVLLAHGYAEHCGRYAHLRSALTRAGYDVAYYDHAGHGTSEGPRARVDVGALIRDFGDARRAALAHARTPDLFLFGHSMGGIIAAASTILDPTRLRGTVLSAPALRPLPPRLPRPRRAGCCRSPGYAPASSWRRARPTWRSLPYRATRRSSVTSTRTH